MDEAHLSTAFLETLAAVRKSFREARKSETRRGEWTLSGGVSGILGTSIWFEIGSMPEIDFH
jgi:hypothetical protein